MDCERSRVFLLAPGVAGLRCWRMFCVEEPVADAIRLAYTESGELAAVVELRRHYPLIGDNAHARVCVRMIASWTPGVKPEAAAPVDPGLTKRRTLRKRQASDRDAPDRSSGARTSSR